MTAHTSSRSMIAAAIVLACGTAAMADVVTIASGTASGAGIRALTAFGSAGSSTVNYGGGFGPTWQFGNFAANGTFATARSASTPLASVLTTLPGSPWNNPSNPVNPEPSPLPGWTGTHASVMNNNNARWISAGAAGNPSPVTSVLFAIPFAVGSNSLASITLTWATDNGLGSTNGANGNDTPAGNQNGGLFLNGGSSLYTVPNSSTNGGDPRQFGSIQQMTFNNLAVIPNQTNWLYFHQFNWGTWGGSAFVANITMVPLPAPVFGGLAGLAGVGGLVAIRRRRMA